MIIFSACLLLNIVIILLYTFLYINDNRGTQFFVRHFLITNILIENMLLFFINWSGGSHLILVVTILVLGKAYLWFLFRNSKPSNHLFKYSLLNVNKIFKTCRVIK